MLAATMARPTLGEFGPRASLMMRLKLGLLGMARPSLAAQPTVVTHCGWAAPINARSLGGGRDSQYRLPPERWPRLNLRGLLELLTF
jgi:hypothetical protein